MKTCTCKVALVSSYYDDTMTTIGKLRFTMAALRNRCCLAVAIGYPINAIQCRTNLLIAFRKEKQVIDMNDLVRYIAIMPS